MVPVDGLPLLYSGLLYVVLPVDGLSSSVLWSAVCGVASILCLGHCLLHLTSDLIK